jgi:D-lactate dehydrogenase
MGLTGKLEAIAHELADEVLGLQTATCCGMAGDRGLLHPELPESAIRDAAAELAEHPVEEHLCSNRTCEIALQQSTGAPYASFVLLLERLSRGVRPMPGGLHERDA